MRVQTWFLFAILLTLVISSAWAVGYATVGVL